MLPDPDWKAKDQPGVFAVCHESRIEERSGHYAGDGSGETVDIAVHVGHCHGEEQGWF